MRRHFLLSIFISLGKYQEFVNNIIQLGEKRVSSYVCVANVHMCIEAYKDKFFAQIVNNANIITPDGLPIVRSLKWLYNINQERITGPDITPMLMEAAEKHKLKIYFYGSTDEILKKLVDFSQKLYPNLMIAGTCSPPFRILTDLEIHNHIKLINDSKANIVFIALGCPKQERWMAEMKGKINAVMIGVGGAFPMLAGIEKRAPLWMQQNMLEWLYRLIQDPNRLFKRYAVTNSLFIFLLTKEKIKLLFTKQP